MKTKEELNALKEEVETLNKKLAELSEDELKVQEYNEHQNTDERMVFHQFRCCTKERTGQEHGKTKWAVKTRRGKGMKYEKGRQQGCTFQREKARLID